MECKTCGAQIAENSAVCPNCESAAKTVTQKKKYSGLCVAGFVFGIMSVPGFMSGISAMLAILFSALGIKGAKAKGEKGVALAKWGIGLGIFSLCALAVVLVYNMLDFAAR